MKMASGLSPVCSLTSASSQAHVIIRETADDDEDSNNLEALEEQSTMVPKKEGEYRSLTPPMTSPPPPSLEEPPKEQEQVQTNKALVSRWRRPLAKRKAAFPAKFPPEYMMCGTCSSPPDARNDDNDTTDVPLASPFVVALSQDGFQRSEDNNNSPESVVSTTTSATLCSRYSALGNDTNTPVDVRYSKDSSRQQNEQQAPTTTQLSCAENANDVVVLVVTLVRSSFAVQGLCCSSEVPAIRKIIRSLPGIQTIQVNPTVRRVYVQHDDAVVSAKRIQEELTSAGFPATILQNGTQPTLPPPHSSTVSQSSTSKPAFVTQTVEDEDDMTAVMEEKEWDESFTSDEIIADTITNHQPSSLPLPVILSGIFWIISVVAAINDWYYLEYAGLLAVVFGLPPVLRKAFRTVAVRRQFDANCMMVIAALGALLLGQLDEAASVSFLFAISEFLEMRATERARKVLSDLCNLKPDCARLIHPVTHQIITINVTSSNSYQIPIGSCLSVRTGDKIAADAIVMEGTSCVDESSLTGESIPVRKAVGDAVYAGSINIGATQLIVQTTSTIEDSTVSRLIRLVEEAAANRSPTETMIDAFAQTYTPAVVALALCMATIPWFIGGIQAGRQWTMNALILIVIACPCALTISTPVTYAAGLAAAAKCGIVIKGGASLEALGSVGTVVLDKTGTLTEGKFAVKHLELVEQPTTSPDDGTTPTQTPRRRRRRTREEMLELLAVMEAPSSHPLSATLVQAARDEGVMVPTADIISVQDHTILKGEGVTAIIDGHHTAYVGNRRLFERIGMYAQLSIADRQRTEHWSVEGGTVGFVGVEGEGIIGCYCVTDLVRAEAQQTIEYLQQQGIQVWMLTGDGDGTAQAVAEQVGIEHDQVRSQLLPEDKLHFVGNLRRSASTSAIIRLCQKQPRVLFCGDGVNDGPALAVADIGVSMGEGAALAMEMSDITLMDSNLEKLVYLIHMGTRVVQTIRENILLSLGCKIAVIILTFYGRMTLLYAITSDVGVMLLVTLNGMKLLPGVDISKNDGAMQAGFHHRKQRRRRRRWCPRIIKSDGQQQFASIPTEDAEMC